MSTVSAYAASDSTGHLTKTTITRRDPGPHDVAIDIKFAGICHSDINTVKAEWGTPNYPVVPGHEIAGVVSAPIALATCALVAPLGLSVLPLLVPVLSVSCPAYVVVLITSPKASY